MAKSNDSIQINSTGIKIDLDGLVNGELVDSTIKRGRNLVKYSFTPNINIWDKTDTGYSARYFFTIEVRHDLTDDADALLTKNAEAIDAEIAEDQKRIERKQKLRDDILKLKTPK